MKCLIWHGVRAACGAALLIAIGLATTPPSQGCAIIGPLGGAFRIGDESAIIIWDAATQTQHFIRNASFQAKNPGKDFGFLVPTPTQPALAEAGDDAFETLGEVIRPRQVKAHRWELTALCCPVVWLGEEARHTFSAVGVRVLHTQRVGKYDAAVLEADNGKELNDWLGTHGYVSRPEFVDWLDHYTKAKWKITAFKIADADPAGAVKEGTFRPMSSGTVRMSFAAAKPFFPYREPTDSTGKAGGIAGTRTMRVFFVGLQRMAGRLGETDNTPWTANTPWSDRLPDAACETLVRQLAMERSQLPAEAWLTAFEDRRVERPKGDDLFFIPSEDPRSIIPPPVKVYTRTIYVPVDVLLFGVIGGVYALERRRRARAARRDAGAVP